MFVESKSNYLNSATVPFTFSGGRITMIQGFDQNGNGYGAQCSDSEITESQAKFVCIASGASLNIDFILEVYGRKK